MCPACVRGLPLTLSRLSGLYKPAGIGKMIGSDMRV
jgi:hypothetical protein